MREPALEQMIHNLKSPIAGVKGYVEMIEQQLGKDELDRSKVRRYCIMVRGAIQQIDELLELSRKVAHEPPKTAD